MPETTGFPTRRGLLSALAGVSLVESLLPTLRAQSVNGNRALVCIYHFDGNDSNNLVVPLSPAATPTTPEPAANWPSIGIRF